MIVAHRLGDLHVVRDAEAAIGVTRAEDFLTCRLQLRRGLHGHFTTKVRLFLRRDEVANQIPRPRCIALEVSQHHLFVDTLEKHCQMSM